ncbi:MAG: redoxin domain-containing protein [Planctomycetales bacterium]|nr:redoxin domain-containing protein [Planctomycetales bacterium]
MSRLIGIVLLSLVPALARCQDTIALTFEPSLQEYDLLMKELGIAGSEHQRKLLRLSPEERLAARHRSPYRTFEPRFLILAKEQGNIQGGFLALKWLVDHADPGPSFDQALEILGERYIDHAEMPQICRMLPNRLSPGIEDFLVKVGETHRQPGVRGLAYYCAAEYLSRLYSITTQRLFDEKAWLANAEQRFSQDAIVWFQKLELAPLRDRFDTICRVLHSRYQNTLEATSSRTFGELAAGLEFAFEPVGKQPPPCSGNDSRGKVVDLDALRGRVVVVMFSANWCGPCKVRYGQLRELKREHADRAFEVVTVMADKERSTVQSAIESGDITWPAIWDGQDGPIATAWQTKIYPTIYVIDSNGVIAARDLTEDALDQKVSELLGVDWKQKSLLEKRSRIRELSLRNQKLQSEDLPEFLQGYTELRSLDLSDNPIGDDAITHLLHLTHLVELNLQHTDVSDHGLEMLQPLQSLKLVKLYAGPGSKTTSNGRRNLKKLLPGVTVSFVTH